MTRTAAHTRLLILVCALSAVGSTALAEVEPVVTIRLVQPRHTLTIHGYSNSRLMTIVSSAGGRLRVAGGATYRERGKILRNASRLGTRTIELPTTTPPGVRYSGSLSAPTATRSTAPPFPWCR